MFVYLLAHFVMFLPPPHSSFSPYWQVLKQSTEKDSALHQQVVGKLQDLLKEIQKYLEDQTRKHKTVHLHTIF